MADVFGIEISDLPDNMQAVEVIVIVKALALDDGDCPNRLVVRNSEGVSVWEGMGMTRSAMMCYEQQLTDDLKDEDCRG